MSDPEERIGNESAARPRAPGPRLGIGRTAEVFTWGDAEIIKLLRPGSPERWGELEAAIAARVDATGLAAPHFLGVERVDGRYGLVFERVTGPSMLDRLTRRPWRVDRLARGFAALHTRINETDGAGLPSHVANVRAAIERAAEPLGAMRLDAALRRLDKVAAGSVVCHGDMHPGNVILSSKGPIVIDWLTAGAGPAEADVARTLFLLLGSDIPTAYPPIQRALISGIRRRFTGTYLRHYRRLRSVDAHQLYLWRLLVLAARVSEGIEAERASLLVRIDAELGRAGTWSR